MGGETAIHPSIHPSIPSYHLVQIQDFSDGIYPDYDSIEAGSAGIRMGGRVNQLWDKGINWLSSPSFTLEIKLLGAFHLFFPA